MSRLRPFVALDALITLPVLLACLYSYFLGTTDGGRWFWWIFILCAAAVTSPSLLHLFGQGLNRGVAGVLFGCYFLMLPVLLYGFFYKLHTGTWNVALYSLLILTVAKSFYSVCVVVRT